MPPASWKNLLNFKSRTTNLVGDNGERNGELARDVRCLVLRFYYPVPVFAVQPRQVQFARR